VTALKLHGGDLGDDIMVLRCDLTNAAATVEWHNGDGMWVPSQYQCADCHHSINGLVQVGKQIAAVALELPTVACYHYYLAGVIHC
jgi:hypothetical protein